MFISLMLLAGMASAAAPQIVVTRSRTPEDDIVLSGTTDKLVGALRAHSTGEPMALSEFCLTVHGDEWAVDSLTVRYRETDGDIAASSAAVGPDGVACFTAEDVFVPASPTRRALIMVFANIDDGTDAAPGDSFRVDWTNGVEAIGMMSGDTYDAESATDWVSGPLMVWHGSEPVFIRSSSSPSGPHSAGRQEVLGVNVTPTSNGDVSFADMSFEVVADDLGGSGFATCASLGSADAWDVFDAADPAVPLSDGADWTFADADGTDCEIADPAAQVASVRVAFAEPIDSAAGMTRAFEVHAEVNAASGDTFRLDMTNVGWLDGDDPAVFDADLLVGIPLAGGTLNF